MKRAAVFMAALMLAGCGFSAPPPKRTPPPKAPAPPVSTVSATFTLTMDEILALLDDKTRTEIAHSKDQKAQCGFAKCRVDFVATRNGRFSGHLANGKIHLTLPFTVKSHLKLKGPMFKSGGDASAQGVAQTETALALGPDWKLDAHTQGTIKLSNGDLKIGQLRMHVASLFNHNQEKISAPLFKEMDRRIAQSLRIKDQARRLWLKLQRPIRVGKAPTAWLVLAPEKIAIAGPMTKNNSLSAAITVEGRPHVVIAEAPPQVKPAPLPSPSSIEAKPNSFAVSVPVLLPYDEAAALALKRLHERPPRVRGANVRFDQLRILPSGEDVIVAAHFCVAQGWDPFGWFDACGEAYLRGAPEFDPATETIRISHVHYDIASENAMLAAVRALAGGELGKALETKLVFDVSKDILKLQNDLRTALVKRAARGVIIAGQIRSFGPPTLTWTANGFLADFTAKGTIDADLNIKPPKTESHAAAP